MRIDGRGRLLFATVNSSAGKLVIWRKDQPMETLPWIPDKYCGSVENATPDMSRYAAFASDNCNDVGGLCGCWA